MDSILHSMTTIATGGYSTKSGSIGAFNSQLIDWIIILGMIFGSLLFVHYLAMTKGSYRDLIKDSQVRWFLVLLTILVLTIFSLLKIILHNFTFVYVYRRVCSGSTTCGIRMFRLLLWQAAPMHSLLDFFVHIQSFYLITMRNQCLIMLLIL